MRSLPFATRAWTPKRPPRKPDETPEGPAPSDAGKRARPAPPSTLPQHAVVIDTETTLDVTQRLLFGVARYLRQRTVTPLMRPGWDCVAEAVIYADDLPTADPAGFAELQRYVHKHLADVAFNTRGPAEPDWRLRLLSRTEFAERWWYHLGVPHNGRRDSAVLVFFNAPFDISRVAAGAAPARHDMGGGFSFQVMAEPDGARMPFRPDVAVKQIDSKRALKKNRAVDAGQVEDRGVRRALPGPAHRSVRPDRDEPQPQLRLQGLRPGDEDRRRARSRQLSGDRLLPQRRQDHRSPPCCRGR